MTKHSLKAEKRELLGKKVKNLRKEGLVPANVFGKGVDSLAIKVDKKELLKTFKEAGETSIVDLTIGKEQRPVLFHNIQMDPVLGDVLHADFLQVNLKEKVSAAVPVELIGESPAVKQGLGTLVQMIDEIEVEALPLDLPEKFELDISELTEIDSSVQIKDLKVEKDKVEISLDPEEMIAKVEALREEEEEPVTTEETEGETEGDVEVEGEQKEETPEEENKE